MGSPTGCWGTTAAALVARAHCPVAIIRTNPDGSSTELGVIAVVLNDEPDNHDVVHQAMEEGRRRHATVRQIDRRLDSWVRRYPGCPRPDRCRRHRREILRKRTAAQSNWPLWAVPTPIKSPGWLPRTAIRFVGYPDCSVLVVRH